LSKRVKEKLVMSKQFDAGHAGVPGGGFLARTVWWTQRRRGHGNRENRSGVQKVGDDADK
jgi:hypothetical protein